MNQRRAHGRDLPEYEAEQCRCRGNDHPIDHRGHYARAKRRALQRNVDARPLFDFLALDRFNGNSTERRRRRLNFGHIQNSRPPADRFRQLIRWRRRRSPGKSRKLDNLCTDLPAAGSVQDERTAGAVPAAIAGADCASASAPPTAPASSHPARGHGLRQLQT